MSDYLIIFCLCIIVFVFLFYFLRKKYYINMEQVKHTNEILGMELDILKSTIKKYEEEAIKKDGNIKDLESELDKGNQRCSLLSNELSEKTSTLNKLQCELDGVKGEYESLRIVCEKIEKEKQGTEDIIKNVKVECTKLENEIKSKEAQINSLNTSLNLTKSELNKANDSKNSLTAEKKTLSNKLDNVRNEKSLLETKISELNKAKEQCILSLNSQKEKLKLLQQQKEELQDNLNKSVRELKEVEELLSSEIEKNTVLTNELSEKEKECEILSTENKELSKSLSDLHDDMEDLKDDLDDTTKRLTKKEQKNKELNSQLDEMILANRQLEIEVDEARSQLSDTEKDRSIKQSTLDFVRTVLSAKTIDDKSYIKLYENINLIYNYIDDDIYRNVMCIKKLAQNEQDFFEEKLFHWAASMRKRWLHNKTVIAFVGEFNAGKTSIVNRILSQDNPKIATLPTDVRDTTAIPTYISGGDSNRYSFFSPDNQLKYISEDYFKSVDREMLDAINGADRLIKYFVMTCKNQNLRKMSILDTPGFGSNNNMNSIRTIDVINECDALFWIIDVTSGEINKSSLKIIKENFKRPLYIIINKIDLANTRSNVERVVNQVRQTLKRENISFVKIVEFSNKAPLSNILDIIKEVSTASCKTDYLAEFRSYLNTILEYQKSIMDENWCRYNDYVKKETVLESDFNIIMKNLKEECEDAENIPHWETYLFKSARYEMSYGEYSKLSNLLQNISVNRISELRKISDDRQENKENLQTAWIAYGTEQTKWKNLKLCLDKYDQLCNNLIRY